MSNYSNYQIFIFRCTALRPGNSVAEFCVKGQAPSSTVKGAREQPEVKTSKIDPRLAYLPRHHSNHSLAYLA